MPPLIITPQDNLLEAISRASTENKKLVLASGTHYTKPGVNKKIEIGANGLYIKGKPNAIIERPYQSINLDRSDNNYGLFFIPTPPLDSDWQSGGWTTHINNRLVYEYKVIIRGKVILENVGINCNMGNQGLEAQVDSKKIEHSCMIGCSGKKFKSNEIGFENKFIFIAFESFEVKNIETYNGGYADDIWISRGYFRPNIQKVSIKNITSNRRINNKRATISFSGLCNEISIINADVFKIEIEETSSKWGELPDNTNDPSNHSKLKLQNIKCDILDLAAKGKAIMLDGKKVNTRLQGYFYQVGCQLSDSNIIVPNGQNRRMIRLNHMLFKNVNWHIGINIDGKIMGIMPFPQYGESCEITFDSNTFLLIPSGGIPTTGALVDVQKESANIEGNIVLLKFVRCKFDPKVMQLSERNLYAIKAKERGEYHFQKNEFFSLRDKIIIGENAVITNQGNKTIVKV